MEMFPQEISNFEKFGTYTYEFDDGGNLEFKSPPSNFNEMYVSLPLLNYVYDYTKIKSFYTIEFTEFIPNTKILTETEISNEVSQLQSQNKELQDKLNVLTEKADENITESERLASKQVIIDLRIALKQGTAERDFSDTFPFLPLAKK